MNNHTGSGRRGAGQITSWLVPVFLLFVLLASNCLECWAGESSSTSGHEKQLGGGATERPEHNEAVPSKVNLHVDSDGHGQRPPRGYCVRISRAIKPTSRCYKHLLSAKVTTEGQRHAKQLKDKQRAATNESLARHKLGERLETRAGGAGGPSPLSRRHEELVYVRSETLGDKITNLSTQAINEHLIKGLLGRLTDEPQPQARPSSAAAEQLRMQIMGPSLERCRLAIEQFLCRLVYPSCHFRSIDVVVLVRPPCREDCLLLRDHFCAALNWTQFSQTIQEALKSTLMSTINALDLLVDGDQSASPSMLLASLSSPARAASSDGGAPAARGSENYRQKRTSLANSTRSLAPNHTMSSSNHFYWPHERSIQRCESLPMLWPAHHGAEFVGLTRPTSKAEQFRGWLQTHQARNYWPVCSNAHLTATNELKEPTRGDHSQTAQAGL